MVLAAQNGQKGIKMIIKKCNVTLKNGEVLENCVVTATYNKIYVDAPDADPVEFDPVDVAAIQLVEGSEVITEPSEEDEAPADPSEEITETSDESADPVEHEEV